MKKIIKNKLYDTCTAREIGCYQYSGSSDFYYVYEALYKKRTGEYFLYGEGGAMSKYSVSCGNRQYSGSSEIIPLSKEEAKEWAVENMDADDFMEEFGEVEE